MKKNKFQLKREETKQRLLLAGMDVFCQQGYAATTLEDITSLAGYTKGAFYVHFKNKQDFFFQLMDYQGFFFESSESDQTDVAVSPDLRGTVAYWSRQVLNRYISSTWSLVFYDFYIQNRHDVAVQEYYRAYHKKWVADITRIIDGLKLMGWVSEEKSSHVLAVCCYDLITGSILHHHMCGEKADPEQTAEAIVAMLS